MAIVGTVANQSKWRQLAFVLMALGFSIYCFYDGWISTKYKEDLSNLWFNRVAAVVVFLLFIYLLVKYVKLLRTRVTVDDTGICVDEQYKITWPAIVRIDNTKEDKGLVTIFFQQEGKERKYVLDDYRVNHFDEILDEISKFRPDLLPPAPEASEGSEVK